MTPAKCPNPTCPFLFDPSQVPPGAVIACPRCGLQFTLAGMSPPPPADDLELFEERPNTDDIPTEDRPARRPTPRADGARKRPRDGDRDTEDAESHDDELPRSPGSGAGKLIIFSVVGVLVVCGVLAAVLFLNKRNKDRDAPPDVAGRKEVEFKRYNVAYLPPAGNWDADSKLRDLFKATILAASSKEPTGWLVIDAREMAYNPTAAELHDMAQQRLRQNIDNLKDKLEDQDATLGGIAGKRFAFDGIYRATGDDVKGEVYAVGHQKTAYLVYAFAPERELRDAAGLAQTFADFRASVRFTGKQPAGGPAGGGYTKVFRSKAGTYSLTATEPLWREQRDPSSRDEAADLALSGTLKQANAAEVLVVLLPKGGTAKAFMDKYFDLPENPPQVMELTDDYQGDDPPAGPPNPTATIARYEVRYKDSGSDSRKFVVTAAMEGGGKEIIAVGSCVLKERKAWEKRLVAIVGSLAGVE